MRSLVWSSVVAILAIITLSAPQRLQAQAITGTKPAASFLRYHWTDTAAPASARKYIDPETRAALAVEDAVVLSIGDIKRAELRSGARGSRATVVVTLTPEARDAFAKATAAHVGAKIAVLLDERVITVARIRSPISSLVPVATDIRLALAESLVTRINRAVAPRRDR
jgi:preprotein translocase subunit SecD